MQAPDWYLGELNPGEDVRIPFNAQKDQMCFGYKGNNFHNYEEYLIEASNSNGKTPDNSRYLLKHFSDTQAPAVPYYITLNDGSTSLRLPNTDKKIFKLNNNGKFCFMPTFQVTTPRKVKHGNYGDVLTYTIISKS
ncbi:hypothetical protein AO265_32035 [Pseudomonas sp. ABAC61]|nr:hypothetical protein AO265_32035 [Pseudomonas sp. ABAC61]